MKLLIGLLTSFSSFCFCCTADVAISYPEVLNAYEWNIDYLLDQGEDYLLQGEFEAAKAALSEAITLCHQDKNQKIRLCRALFNQSLSNAALNFENEALADIQQMSILIESFQCKEGKAKSIGQEYFANGKPILGPDKIAVDKCLELVKNTVDPIKDILTIAPVSFKWKASMITAVNLAAQKANSCCRSGGVWKACLQPLFEKWLILKDWDQECRKIGDWYFLPPLD